MNNNKKCATAAGAGNAPAKTGIMGGRTAKRGVALQHWFIYNLLLVLYQPLYNIKMYTVQLTFEGRIVNFPRDSSLFRGSDEASK